MLSVPVAWTWWVLSLSGHSGATEPLARVTQCGAGLRVGDNVGCRQRLRRHGQGRGGMLTHVQRPLCFFCQIFLATRVMKSPRHGGSGVPGTRGIGGPREWRDWGSQVPEGRGSQALASCWPQLTRAQKLQGVSGFADKGRVTHPSPPHGSLDLLSTPCTPTYSVLPGSPHPPLTAFLFVLGPPPTVLRAESWQRQL